MTESTHHCQSCGMTIEAGPYCEYCVDEHGNLQAFEERFERMQQFLRRRDPSLDDATVRARTLDYMATMPAWRDHPKVVGR
ncbi:MAG: hypothetical protein R3F17_01195 [Planctomycetota bacterium]